ncbi:hypothetical protein BOTBODRAFT_328868 [Botryobasidium botryosum FD-172 SS1]|uniref:Uncharacterized protein n=1 Tax=Botryobasidium botryosum (strain FD-172 SS1) TaxID=930990 RepID=A0A067MZD1_BOTB1|nr:hypothetical protein BOTBODRAFT_328868 [Botryobasidium botryosum FD-172 SS1]
MFSSPLFFCLRLYQGFWLSSRVRCDGLPGVLQLKQVVVCFVLSRKIGPSYCPRWAHKATHIMLISRNTLRKGKERPHASLQAHCVRTYPSYA